MNYDMKEDVTEAMQEMKKKVIIIPSIAQKEV